MKASGPLNWPFIVTFLLELPFDLELREGITVPAYERADDVEVPISVLPEEVSKRLAIATRFVFRSSRSEVSRRRTVALNVFANFWEGLEFVDSLPARDELERQVPVTVVAATTATLRYDADTGAVGKPVLVELFERSLRQLNDFLSMLGFCVGNPEIGRVRRTELTRHIPVVLDFRRSETGKRQFELATFELPGYGVGSVPTEEAALAALDLSYRDRLSEWPFRSVVMLIHRAHRDLYAGDGEQAVIGLTTAVEIISEEVIAAALRAKGEAHRVDAVLQAGLANLLQQQLSPLLLELGADPAVAEAWRKDRYALRKRVAHEGYAPRDAEGAQAYATTVDLVRMIGTALRSTPNLAEVGDQLPFGL
jgi:hypothetical protein